MELPPLLVLAAALEKMEKTAVLPTPDESIGSSRIQARMVPSFKLELFAQLHKCPYGNYCYGIKLFRFGLLLTNHNSYTYYN